MKKQYPELVKLENFIKLNSVYIKSNTNFKIDNSLTPIIFSIKNEMYSLHIMDEYGDLKFKNKLLDVVLALRELELIEESNDYLVWCKQLSLKPKTKLLNYYTDTIKFLPKIQSYFPKKTLTSFIADIDYQLNSGAIQTLRK